MAKTATKMPLAGPLLAHRPGLLFFCLSMAGGLMAAPAVAQTQEQKASAEALFREGRALLADGRINKACTNFEESQRIDPAMGTQFRLAECYEKQGKLASAWSLFLEVAGDASAIGAHRREAQARKNAAAIEPLLAKLVVRIPEDAAHLADLVVTRNGSLFPAALWGKALPVDAGIHRFVATSAGKTSHLQIQANRGSVVQVELPALRASSPAEPAPQPATPAIAPAAVAPAPTTPSQMEPEPGGGMAPVGVVGMVLGGGAIVAGVAMGVVGRSQNEGADCDAGGCSAEGQLARQDAHALADAATGVFVAGAALVAGGFTLWLLAPDPATVKTGSPSVVHKVGLGPGSASWEVRW